MKKLLLIFCLGMISFGFAQERQEIYQRAKINYTSIEDLKTLSDLDIPVDHGVHKKGHFLISEFSISEINRIKNAGFKIDVLIEDAAAFYLQQQEKNLPSTRNLFCDGSTNVDYTTPDNFNLGSMGGYFTYQEVLDQLDLMKSMYPDLITEKENISNFLTNGQPDNATTPPIGGNGIKWVKISDNPNSDAEGEPQILYTAIHHAREPTSLSQLIFYMWYLLENYEDNPEIQSIVNNTELYFVPVINPDGYLYNEKTNPNGGGYWRKNRFNGHGVDLNRNYDYFIDGDPNQGVWGGAGTSGDTGSDIYRGTAPFSEVEAQAMKWFCEQHDFVMAFNNHSSGDLLLFPHGYAIDTPTVEHDLFSGIAAELVSQNGYTDQIAADLYAAAGNSDDFMYGTVGTHDKIYSFTPEIGDQFWLNSNDIIPTCKEMMYLNITAAKMVNNYASVKETSPLFVGNNATVESPFDIKRLGVSGSGDFTVSIAPVSANISAVGTPVSFTGLEPLETSDGMISYTLQAGIQAGDDIVFELIVNNGDYDSSTLITKKFGSLLPIFEDPGNSVSDNFINDGWDITTSTYVSPSSSITESPSGDYSNNTNKTITLTNEIDLTNAIGANASFYAKWEIENNWDYTQFEVSIDNGNNWIPQCGNYTNEGSGNSGQPTGEPLYDGFQTEWVFEEINLSDYLGEQILVRFQFRSDGLETEDGFYFDDLKINIVEDGTVGVEDFENNIFNVYPNPVQDVLNITTPITNYAIEVYTIQGQLIQKKTNISASSTFDYSSYADGIYLMKLSSENNTQTIKIVKQ